MIIVNSENTSVTNRRCIRIVRTGETAYVYIIIFDLYVRNIWKASGIRLKGSLGSVEVITDSGILPGENINPLLWSEYKVYKVKKCGYIELDIQ